MVNVNKVLFGGYLVADPETQAVGTGAVTKFTVANNRKWTNSQGEAKEEATFVDCEAWAKVGEVAQNYLRKGRPVLVEGRLKLDKWKQGEQMRQKLKLTVETIQFLDAPGQGGGGEAQPAPQQEQAAPAATAAPSYEPEPF